MSILIIGRMKVKLEFGYHVMYTMGATLVKEKNKMCYWACEWTWVSCTLLLVIYNGSPGMENKLILLNKDINKFMFCHNISSPRCANQRVWNRYLNKYNCASVYSHVIHHNSKAETTQVASNGWIMNNCCIHIDKITVQQWKRSAMLAHHAK